MKTRLLSASLSTALALAFAAPAAADDTPAAGDADTRALAEARAELERASRRYAELARTQSSQGQVLALRAAGEAADARDLQARIARVRNRPMLGVLLAPDEQSGVRITGVTPDGPAAKAGLRSGDRLVSVDGTEILGSSGELRVENARKLIAGLAVDAPVELGYVRDGRRASLKATPQRDGRLAVFSHADGNLARPGAVFLRMRPDGDLNLDADAVEIEALTGIAPEIRREVTRIVDGEVPRLLSAFRWNGLNLASVDAQLGRYFGTDTGVLVLSSGPLPGLQGGDVILRIEGKPVATPQEAMRAMGAKQPGEQARLQIMRDKARRDATVTVPERMRTLDFVPAPPAPPAPPRPAAPRTPPAPPAPPPPPAAASTSPPAPASPPAPPHDAGESAGAILAGLVPTLS